MFGLNNSSGIPVMPALAEKLTENPQWFTEGGNGVEPSWPGADWFNAMQAEILNVLSSAEIEPIPNNLGQLNEAINIIGKNYRLSSIATAYGLDVNLGGYWKDNETINKSDWRVFNDSIWSPLADGFICGLQPSYTTCRTWSKSGLNTLKCFGGNPTDGIANANAYYRAAKYLNGSDAIWFDGWYVIARVDDLGSTPVVHCGLDGSIGGLIIDTTSWPYATVATPHIKTTGNFIADRIGIDQCWDYKQHATPGGYNDSTYASSWGGYFMFDLTSNNAGISRITNCFFNRVMRGILVSGRKLSEFTNNFGDQTTSAGQCVISSQLCEKVVYDGCIMNGPKWGEVDLYNGYPVAGGCALHGYDCDNVELTNLTLSGHQLVFHGPVGGLSKNLVIDGITVDYPIADTAFYRWENATIGTITVSNSGDMGITLDGCKRISFGVLSVTGAHIGGVVISDAISVVGTCIQVSDYAQAYDRMNVFRQASNAGNWLSAFSCSFQAGASDSIDFNIGQIVLGWSSQEKLPPVSDPSGPVRSLVNGILVGTTPNPDARMEGTIVGARVGDWRGSGLDHVFINVPEYRFYLAMNGISGIPKLGEKFVDSNGNSFVYLADYGSQGLCWCKSMSGTIPAGTVFTGQTSGATLTSANLPQLTWTKTVLSGCFDFTSLH